MEQVEKDFEQLYINFKQDDNYMSIADYEQILKSTKIIFDNITQDIMELGPDVELMVYAPQKGCIITIFGVKVNIKLIIAGIVAFAETEMGKAFIEELTGHKPEYWVRQPAKLIKTLIIKMYSMSQQELAEFIENFRKYDEVVTKLDKSRKAVSNVFQMCYNSGIEAVGFNKEDIYTVEKSDFEKHITEDLNRDLRTETVTKQLKIIRPVTANNLKDKWTLADIGSSDGQNYIMEDARFQAKTLDGNFVKQGANDDEIVAQIEYKVTMKNGEERQKDRKVLMVYTMNGESFEGRVIPEGTILNEPKKIVVKDEHPRQTNLFDLLNNTEEENNA